MAQLTGQIGIPPALRGVNDFDYLHNLEMDWHVFRCEFALDEILMSAAMEFAVPNMGKPPDRFSADNSYE